MNAPLLGAAALLASAGIAAAETSVQSCNRTVTFDAPPERAVSNDVNLTEMMLVLGLRDRMVGYTGISGWKTLDEEMRAGVEELPELSAKYPSKEVLAGADADFFFAGWNYGMKVGGEVTPETLRAKSLAKSRWDVLKILGEGELTKKLKVSAHRFSKSAEEKIAKAKGDENIPF